MAVIVVLPLHVIAEPEPVTVGAGYGSTIMVTAVRGEKHTPSPVST